MMEKIQIELSELEYCLLLNDSLINNAFAELLESFVSDGEYCHVAATREEVAELVRYIEIEINETKDKRRKKEFMKLCEYLKST